MRALRLRLPVYVWELLVVATVVVMFLPLGPGTRNRAEQARADVQWIAATLTRFYVDLRHLPTCSADDCNPLVGTGAAANNKLTFLAVGDGGGDLTARYPGESPSLRTPWRLRANADPISPRRNNAANHLVENDPNVDGVLDELDYSTTGRRQWRGPYALRLGLDPWGRAYIVSVGAMEAGGQPVAPGARGWILSGGPNGVLETAPDAAVLGGDDVGIILLDASLYGP